MAGEIHPSGPTGLTCHVHIRNYSGQIWNGTAFEDFNNLNLANYAISVTEDGSTGTYVASMPTAIEVGNYDIYLFDSGGSVVGGQYIQWRGVGGTTVEQIGDIDYSDIKQQVIYNLGRGNDTDILAQMSMYARMALLDVQNWREGWFMHAEAVVPVVDGTQEYDLPADHKGNLKIFVQKSDRWVELRGPIDLVEARRRFTPLSTGEPTDWSYSGASKFKVWPGDPDASFTLKLDYTRYLAALEDDSDTNTLTVQYPQLLIALMTMYGYRYLQEWEDADKWQAAADKSMLDAHANYVARVFGRDFTLVPRADVYGTADQSRGLSQYIVLR